MLVVRLYKHTEEHDENNATKGPNSKLKSEIMANMGNRKIGRSLDELNGLRRKKRIQPSSARLTLLLRYLTPAESPINAALQPLNHIILRPGWCTSRSASHSVIFTILVPPRSMQAMVSSFLHSLTRWFYCPETLAETHRNFETHELSLLGIVFCFCGCRKDGPIKKSAQRASKGFDLLGCIAPVA